MARRILTKATGSLHVIKIDLDASRYADFWTWRIEVRNLIDYRRRQDRCWRDLMMAVWLSSDGHVRGISGLGSLNTPEIVSAFAPRWETAIRPIDHTDLRSEILAAVNPAVIADTPSLHRRYQFLKFSVWPQRGRRNAVKVSTLDPQVEYLEPMPVVF